MAGASRLPGAGMISGTNEGSIDII
ncbi:uncharacterized protein METZ01_LOCUS351094, partial [marine metagenome]